MRSFLSAAAILAFANLAFAGILDDFDAITVPSKITAGDKVTIKWTAPEKYKSVSVQITLIGGKDQPSQVAIGAPIASKTEPSYLRDANTRIQMG